MNVYGNTIINNEDPKGGITLAAAGYLNLVCGAERVDVTGLYTKTPSTLAKATYTNIVNTPTAGTENKSSMPGDYYEEITTQRQRTVGANETVAITGIQRVTAAQIYLN